MKKHELLKYAYDNYPNGTKFKSVTMLQELVSDGNHIIDGTLVLMDGWEVYKDGKWAEIITEEKPKSILDGKVAIQVNNEREFKLLMEHYESKGWKSEYIEISAYPYYIDYKDKFDSSENIKAFTVRDEKIIPFQDFAKEVGIKAPRFIMTSEDGVDLYEGDKFYHIKLTTNGWAMNTSLNYDDNAFTINKEFNHLVKTMPQFNKAFSTRQLAEQFIKENALKWIEEQNKPKEISLLENEPVTVKVTKDGFISSSNEVINLSSGAKLEYQQHHEFTGKELEQIYKAYKSLK